MKRAIICLLQLLFFQKYFYGQNVYHIHLLRHNNPVFKKLMLDVMENQRLMATGKTPLILEFFTYIPKSSDTIYSIAARLNIPYDTIATLNNISSPILFPQNNSIYLPNMAGLVIRHDNNDPFFIELKNTLKDEEYINFTFSDLSSKTKIVTGKFYPNHRFSPAKRTKFLLGFFLPPLQNIPCIITSEFGKRRSPTKKGKWELHTGVDYRAPLNSKVQSSRFGTVKEVGTNQVLGHYIIVQHEKNFQTVYGHLSKFFVQKGNKVSSGQIIAESGNTGHSTGPHLHFEIRINGSPINPLTLLKIK